MSLARPAIVAHPAGGYTLAVPAADGSTVRYYHGWWARRPRSLCPRAAFDVAAHRKKFAHLPIIDPPPP